MIWESLEEASGIIVIMISEISNSNSNNSTMRLVFINLELLACHPQMTPKLIL